MSLLRAILCRQLGERVPALDEAVERIQFTKLRPRSSNILLETRSTTAIAFSDNGRYVATAHGDKTVRVFKAESLAELRTLRGHHQTPCSIAWVPGRADLLASGESSEDGNDECFADVIIWDVVSGAQLARRGVLGPVRGLVFQPMSSVTPIADSCSALSSLGLLLLVAAGRRLFLWPCGMPTTVEGHRLPPRDLREPASPNVELRCQAEIFLNGRTPSTIGLLASQSAAAVPAPNAQLPSYSATMSLVTLATFATPIRALQLSACGHFLLMALAVQGDGDQSSARSEGQGPNNVRPSAASLLLWLWEPRTAMQAVQTHDSALSAWHQHASSIAGPEQLVVTVDRGALNGTRAPLHRAMEAELCAGSSQPPLVTTVPLLQQSFLAGVPSSASESAVAPVFGFTSGTACDTPRSSAVGTSAETTRVLDDALVSPLRQPSEQQSPHSRHPQSALAVATLSSGQRDCRESTSALSPSIADGIALDEMCKQQQQQRLHRGNIVSPLHAQPVIMRRDELWSPRSPRRPRIASLDIALESRTAWFDNARLRATDLLSCGTYSQEPQQQLALRRQRSFSASDATLAAQTACAPHPPFSRCANKSSATSEVMRGPQNVVRCSTARDTTATLDQPPLWQSLVWDGRHPHLQPCLPDYVLLPNGSPPADLATALSSCPLPCGSENPNEHARSLVGGTISVLREWRHESNSRNVHSVGLIGPVLVDALVSVADNAGMSWGPPDRTGWGGVAVAAFPPQLPLSALLAAAKQHSAGGSHFPTQPAPRMVRAPMSPPKKMRRQPRTDRGLSCFSATDAAGVHVDGALPCTPVERSATLRDRLGHIMANLLVARSSPLLQSLLGTISSHAADVPTLQTTAPFTTASFLQTATGFPFDFWAWLGDALAVSSAGILRSPEHLCHAMIAASQCSPVSGNKRKRTSTPYAQQSQSRVDEPRLSPKHTSTTVTKDDPSALFLVVSLWQQLAWRVAGLHETSEHNSQSQTSLSVATLVRALLGCGGVSGSEEDWHLLRRHEGDVAPITVLSLKAVIQPGFHAACTLSSDPQKRQAPFVSANAPMTYQTLSAANVCIAPMIASLPCGLGWPLNSSVVHGSAPGTLGSVQLFSSEAHVLSTCGVPSSVPSIASGVHVAELPRSIIRVQHVSLSHGTGSRRRDVQRLAIAPSGPLVDLRSTTTLVSVALPVPRGLGAFIYGTHRGQVRLVAAQKERFDALE